MKGKALATLVPVGFSLVAVGCGHTPTAQDILGQYLAAWQKQDYQKMYGFLSKTAQSHISQSAFINRYKEIYQGISAEGLSTKTLASQDQQTNSKTDATLDFQATWKTALTDAFTEKYTAHLVKGQNGWKIDWNSSLIFPQLKLGWKVHAQAATATRGQIVTASGQYMAQNQIGENIGFVPGKMKSSSTASLARVLNVSQKFIKSALNQSWVKPDLFVPIKTMPRPKEQTLEKKLLAIPGVLITTSQTPVRVYPQGETGDHVVGYVGPITAKELTAKRQKEGYSATDTIGQQGLEAALEPQLRGQIGGKIWVSDAQGKSTQILAQRAPTPGDNVTLTFNTSVEQALSKALGSNTGSAVVLDASTGAVLAMASKPGFNPNELAGGLTTSQWNQINNAKVSPLINRALSAVPPGSAIKPLVAGAALQTKAIKPSTTFSGTDKLKWQKDSSWGNFYVTRVPHPAGTVDLKHALIWSDNIYFAQVGLALGPQKFISGLSQFGFGTSLKFPLSVEKAQLSDNGKMTSDIQLANSAYGQGQVLVSPLQLASMYTAFTNNGDVLEPYIVKKITSSADKVVQTDKRSVLFPHALTAQTVTTINSDLRQIVTNPTGTAHGIDGVPGWVVSGKTGTAQTKAGGPEWGWFVALANRQDGKKYLIVMALANTQNSGGSHLAVHQVRKFLEFLH